MNEFNVGDVLVPKQFTETPLHCGTGYYSHAICVSQDPFIMVSESGDMLWSQHSSDDFLKIGVAPEKVLKVVNRRYQSYIS